MTDFKKNVMLIVIGVTLLVALMNFGVVFSAVMSVLGLFSPLVVGGIIAFVLNVPMKGIEKGFVKLGEKYPSKLLKPVRVYSLLLTYLALFTVLYFIGSVVIPSTAESVKSIAETVRDNYPVWLDWAKEKGLNVARIEKFITNLDFSKIAGILADNGEEMFTVITGSLGAVIGKVGTVAIGFIFSIYILLAKERLGRQAKMLAYAYMKKSWADKCCEVAKLSHRIFSKFISGQCLEAVIIGALFFIALSIAGLPYASTIGIVIGATSLVPIIGAFIGCFFGLILIITVSAKKAAIFLVIFIIIQQFEGHGIYPNVVGNSVGLPAIWTMLAVIVGGSVGGIGGIMLFIPLFSVFYVLLRKDVYKRLKDEKFV